MSHEIVHLAGPQITFGSVSRQRCVWCGALIEEHDWSRIGVQIDDSASDEVQQEEIARARRVEWTGFVAIEGTNPICKSTVPEPEDGKAPERSCMRLLPEPPQENTSGGGADG